MIRTILAAIIALMAASTLRAQPLYFPPTTGEAWDTLSPQSLGWCPNKIDSLYAYLDSQQTKAFIILKDGKIVLEKYFGTHTQTTSWQWASAGKTIVSYLIGIAQQEGHLSTADTTSEYLGAGWTNCTPDQEEKITIHHQLAMTSGLDDGVANSSCTADTCLVYKAAAGTRWAYHNAPYTLLGRVIENATGVPLNLFTTQKLKSPIGMTGAFLQINDNRTYFSNARSMARFGLLILNRGNWNGTPLMTDTAYFDQMVSPSQAINPAYGYLWWLNGQASYMLPGTQFVFGGALNPQAPADVQMAIGKDGQLLNIASGERLVWLRMGDAPDEMLVPVPMNDKIWEHLRALECAPTSVRRPFSPDNRVHMFPNPGTDQLTLSAAQSLQTVEIFSAHGHCVRTLRPGRPEVRITIGNLPGGMYLVKARLASGEHWTGKLIKE